MRKTNELPNQQGLDAPLVSKRFELKQKSASKNGYGHRFSIKCNKCGNTISDFSYGNASGAKYMIMMFEADLKQHLNVC